MEQWLLPTASLIMKVSVDTFLNRLRGSLSSLTSVVHHHYQIQVLDPFGLFVGRRWCTERLGEAKAAGRERVRPARAMKMAAENMTRAGEA